MQLASVSLAFNPKLSPPFYKCKRVLNVGKALAIQNADELQEQLGSLMDEARAARMRADKARSRFMRLTEAVEQMSQRAAAEVKVGNEGAARQLLMEKKNVMSALEISKRRAELLEEFAAKLNEAISKKETRLIASLSQAAQNLDIGEDSSYDVRIVSPREDSPQPEPEPEDEREKETGESTEEISEELEQLSFLNHILDIDYVIATAEEKLEYLLKRKNEFPDDRVALVEQVLEDLRRARSRISEGC